MVHSITGTDAPNVVTQSTWRDSNALQRSINARLAINLAISQVGATKRNMHTPNQGDLKCTPTASRHHVCMYSSASYDHSDDDSTADNSFCL